MQLASWPRKARAANQELLWLGSSLGFFAAAAMWFALDFRSRDMLAFSSRVEMEPARLSIAEPPGGILIFTRRDTPNAHWQLGLGEAPI
jgi:hypothetical protein